MRSGFSTLRFDVYIHTLKQLSICREKHFNIIMEKERKIKALHHDFHFYDIRKLLFCKSKRKNGPELYDTAKFVAITYQNKYKYTHQFDEDVYKEVDRLKIILESQKGIEKFGL